ncbi:uncharacterized protein IWZ02DRAFT_105229 [Phyllosticta citriasiana]|uniref:uncharacterized protein n=1 Tax=Phyllosticta citriasiana TaxID=595635 RepID=UPI0030FDDF22
MAQPSSQLEVATVARPHGCMSPAGPLVRLVVGPERKLVVTHRDLVCRHSDVLRNALTGPWAEGTTNTLELPDSDPVVVENFVIWANGGHMLGPMFALELYVWAEKYQVPLLKADAAHTLYWHWSTWNRRTRTQCIVASAVPDANVIHFALDNLPESNRIIQLLRVVHNLWHCRMTNYRALRKMRAARFRLFSTVPYGPLDKIEPAHVYYAGGKRTESVLGCPHALTSKTNMRGCYDCLWLAEEKPWLMNGVF